MAFGYGSPSRLRRGHTEAVYYHEEGGRKQKAGRKGGEEEGYLFLNMCRQGWYELGVWD